MQGIQKIGLSIEFCCLACTFGGARRCHMLSKSGGKMAGNGLVSGDGRISRWRTVEECSHRLWCGSVMTVREKCDEKELKGWNPRLCVKRRQAGRRTIRGI